ARSDKRGNVTLHGVADGQEINRVTGLPPGGGWVCLSRNARYVSFLAQGGRPALLSAWDLRANPPRRLLNEPAAGVGVFSQDSTRLALVHGDGSLRIQDLLAGRLALRLPLGITAQIRSGWVAWSPQGRQVAVARRKEVVVVDLTAGKEL